MTKKVYLAISDGFSDQDMFAACARIQRENSGSIRVVARSLHPVKSQAGLKIIPDVDFIASSDLVDIDSSNTAMVILPGGTQWKSKEIEFFKPLVRHCTENQIAVLAMSEAATWLAALEVIGRGNGHDYGVTTDNRILEMKELLA